MVGKDSHRRAIRWWIRSLLVISLVVGWAGPGYGQMPPTVIHNSSDYFPDEPGNEWRYRGRITEGTVDQVKDTTFENVSTVTGQEKKDGVMVMVFHDTSPGGQSPIDSYYLRDVAGIRYYGSKPGTVLERQLIPYQIVRFPLEVPSAFQQLDRKNLNLGLDIDRDNQGETVDVEATVTIFGQEPVTVPAGTYDNAIRLEAHMQMRVRLSSDGTRVYGYDTLTAWIVKDIGLVKYIERQMIPTREAGKERLIEITEELEGATLQGGSVILGRRHLQEHGVPVRASSDPIRPRSLFPFRSGLHHGLLSLMSAASSSAPLYSAHD